MAKISVVKELLDESGEWDEEKHEFKECDPGYTYLVVDGEPVMKLAGNHDVQLRDGVEMLEYDGEVYIG